MDILLAHGYYLYEDPHELKVMKPYPPLGILYISSHLKAKGFDVGVFDSTFRSMAEFEQVLEAERPSVVGLYCNLMTKLNILKMIPLCKRIGATVVVGGPEPPYYAENFLDAGADIVVTGEGELTLEELLPHLAQHGLSGLERVLGISYRDADGQVVKNLARPYIKNLDEQPFPDRAAIDLQRYVNTWKTHHGMGSVSLICARGCPYHCTWCSHSVFGETHRRRSVTNVADEVQMLIETYHPDMLWYADDVFTIHTRWFFAYVEEMKRRGIKIPFECISRADRMNEQIIQGLADLGCFRVWIGSESGSQRVLDAMRREVTVDEVQVATRTAQKYGIETGMFIMLGYEGEEIADLEATVEHLKRAGPDIFLTTVAYPIKGTPYYREVETRLIDDLPWDARTERDLSVKGRRSKRFYSYATRWMVNEVAAHRAWTNGQRDLPRLAKALVNARIGRLGMALTQNEVEV
jgi:radical SAM superfamily enzyme YgiQ (UPF0313 family)